MANTEVIDKLEALGFKAAHQKIKHLAEKKRKLMIAYENYRFVRQDKIDAFNKRLRDKTISKDGWGRYQTLAFTSVEEYTEVPPDHVLLKMGEAVDRKCFDSFEIAHIVDVKDPILFGRIKGCPDRFYIDQWDNDVKIEDILDKNEG